MKFLQDIRNKLSKYLYEGWPPLAEKNKGYIVLGLVLLCIVIYIGVQG